jgi:hypothetical protein
MEGATPDDRMASPLWGNRMSMEIQFSRLINHKIIVIGPEFFDKERLENVRLLGVDAAGIWIESEEVLNRIVDKYRVKPSAPGLAFFIPFGHITTILASFDPAPAA